MLVTKRTFTHICKFDCSLRTCIHEPIAALRVKLSSSDDLCKFLHVRGFDIDNVKALVLDIQVPEIYPQIIAADESFSIAVDRYAVDVIGMSVCVGSTGHGGNDGVVMCHSRELER